MNTDSRSLFQCCRPIVLAILLPIFLNGCVATKQSRAYQTEDFTADSPFQYYSSREPVAACEIGKRALLSQGYQVESAQPLNVSGEKYFQPVPDHATKLTITLICLPSSLGAVIYANALETNFELKSSGSSAGVSVSGLGSLSLPWTADKATRVKTGEATVTAPEFYQKLFELIKTLDG